MANMQEIARRAGVSLGTVSHVLNNTANVREPKRSRVLEAVQAAGYQPSQLARGLRRETTNMIGMIIPDITNPFFPAVVRGAEDVAFSNGYRVILGSTDNDHSKEIIHLNELRTYLPAGLIVIPSSFSDLTAQAESYRQAGACVVVVDRLPKNWSGDSVTSNNEIGAFNATKHLLQIGHTNLGIISGPLHLTNAKERLGGFMRAMKRAKVPISPEYIQEATFDKAGGYAKTLVLLRLRPRPTAIFAGNDMMALGALLAVREAGLRCPEEISIMGFDNMDLCETTNPSLSSVSQPGYQLGTAAARLLLDRKEGDTSPAKNIVLQTVLALRDSVAPPSEAKAKPTAKAGRKQK
jgi:DNA-binding LacI/PurR family transcriptional regulator